MKLLFLSRWYPYPADNGSRLRIYHLIRWLASRHDVSLVSFTDDVVQEGHIQAMRDLCLEVKTAPYRPFHPHRLKAMIGLLAPVPRSVVDTHSEEMSQLVLREALQFQPHAVIASQIDMASYARRLSRRLSPVRMLEELEVTSLYEAFARERRDLRRLRARLTWQKLVAYLRAIMRDFDGCTVVSGVERRRVIEASSAAVPVAVVPNGVDVEACARVAAQPEPDTLIYSGALTYDANFDAVSYFLREIFPLIQARRPGVRLFVTGKLKGVRLDVLPRNDNVVFTGYLEDVRPRIAQSWVSVVPLRVGGGTRLKILESLALGTPVVSTSKGAEGLDLVDGRDLLIADSAEKFAADVVKVLEDRPRREQLSLSGQRAVAAKYDWRVIGQTFCEFVERTAQSQMAREI